MTMKDVLKGIAVVLFTIFLWGIANASMPYIESDMELIWPKKKGVSV